MQTPAWNITTYDGNYYSESYIEPVRTVTWDFNPNNGEYYTLLTKAREVTRTNWQIGLFRTEDSSKLEGCLYVSDRNNIQTRVISFYGRYTKQHIAPIGLLLAYLRGMIDGCNRIAKRKYVEEEWEKMKAYRISFLRDLHKKHICFKSKLEFTEKGGKFDPSNFYKTPDGYVLLTGALGGSMEFQPNRDEGDYYCHVPEIRELVYRADKKTNYEYKIHRTEAEVLVDGVKVIKTLARLDYYDEIEEETVVCNIPPLHALVEHNESFLVKRDSSSVDVECVVAYLSGVADS
jgi:hypothetical protein